MFKKQADGQRESVIAILDTISNETRQMADGAIYGKMSVSPDGGILAAVKDSTIIKLVQVQ